MPNVIVLSGAFLLSDLIAARRQQPLLVGPDEESAQWVALASRHGFDHARCRKIRHGDRSVHVALPGVAVTGRQVVLPDDVASTGHTIARGASAAGCWRSSNLVE